MWYSGIVQSIQVEHLKLQKDFPLKTNFNIPTNNKLACLSDSKAGTKPGMEAQTVIPEFEKLRK
jgi:hypothetical protein